MIERLEKVSKPGRYIGGEVNAVIKSESEIKLRIALAFPEVYEIGMSHLGLKILYGMINERPEFWAERVMAPWIDKEKELRRHNLPLTSLESNRPLAEFDLIGFSLQYELTYTNVLNMLDLAGIPLLARDRGPETPLIVGGGPCAFSPEPLADFFDFFYLGDAEAGFMKILDQTAEWKAARGSRFELLASLAKRPGVYVPSFFEPIYDSKGRLIEIKPLHPGYERVDRAVIPDLDSAYFPDRPVVPLSKPVHNRLVLEIARGCTRGCRFCQAGFIYRPVRERRPGRILDLAASSLAATGWEEASFLSLSAGDYTCLAQLMTAFMDTHAAQNIALSLPSLRVKSLTPTLMRQIKRVRKTGFTLAPEAGTQRLRDVINKDLSDDDLITAARDAFGLGWRLIKLYFMVGLPTETMADVEAIVDLSRRVRAGSKNQVNVSFATFIPKANTPFQWEPMLDLEEMRSRRDTLLDLLKKPGLKPKWNQPDSSLLEGILARGDRRLGSVVRLVHAMGGRFEGWSERLDLNLWYKALTEAGLDPASYLRARDMEEVLPWSHLISGVTQEYLKAEREKAFLGGATADCRDGACGQCGVCDFSEIKPSLCDPDQDTLSVEKISPTRGTVKRIRINYAKAGLARYLSHLETVEVFVRGLRRAGLEVCASQGFHPMPRIRFATALPVGLASMDEYAEAELINPPEVETIKELFTSALPRGFKVLRVMSSPNPQAKLKASGARFKATAAMDIFDRRTLNKIVSQDRIVVTKKGKKGLKDVDLKPLLGDLKLLTERQIEITLFAGTEASVRVSEAVEKLFNLTPAEIDQIEFLKLETLLS
ncbi:MAG: TIGR03960 family B12-binding radical SAM protein [Deltaproteobacteria bacterium]|nr:TIGR03960 family B12-binding radical SAM protein [Deltaproteobacteria bacterium]MBW2053159.1 TIGR03960 family B12-binding radical SAM protein [Deltaproteobacteria bacterium]MBW2141660.1 TIGR03960 family B12-binding radical SAM protein [Deltaproteobacteria bacterium]MBW2323589.1 TIGR03960 family B12-binding radical SAM protein [Deltaproteobacteria bacterium]